MVDSSRMTLRFIGVLNKLCRDYEIYGVMPKSRSDVVNEAYLGLVYDDSKVSVDENGWTMALLENGINGETYNDMFPDAIFAVRWKVGNFTNSDDTFQIIVNVGGDTYFIEKSGWHI